MKTLALLLLAASASASPLDDQFDQAQAAVDEIARVLAAVKDRAAAEKACRDSFTMEAWFKERAPVHAFAVLPGLRDAAAGHLACRALAADDPAVCAPLEPYAAYLCRRDSRSWAFDRSRLGDGKDFLKRCLEENSDRWPGDEGPFRPDGWKAACAALEDHRAGKDDAAATCARIGPLFSPAVSGEECVKRVRWFFGEDPALCDGLRSSVARDRCREIAAYKAKPAARDCAPSLAAARASWCGRFTRDYAWALHADLSVVLERAADLVAKTPGSAPRLLELETRRQDLAAALGVQSSKDVSAPALPGAEFSEVDAVLGEAALGEAAGRCELRGGSELTKPLEEYFACQARVLDAPAVCKALDLPGYKGSSYPPAYRCRHNFLMWNADVARLSGTPDSPNRCIAENYYRWRDPFDGGPFKPGAFREGCGIIADYSVRGADLKATCERVLPVFRYSTKVGDCVDRFRYAHGQDLKLCLTLKNPPVKLDRCQGLVALRSFLRDGVACGGSKYCHMQTELVPQNCGPYLDEVRKGGCSGALSGELLDRAEKKLDALRGAPAAGVERRRAYLRWLRGRVSAAVP